MSYYAATRRGLLLPCIIALAGCTNGPSSIPVPLGTWGGAGVDGARFPVELEVTAGGAKLFAGCFGATIPQPVVMDRAGRFAADGTWSETLSLGRTIEYPSHFSGQVEGTTMTLTATAQGRVQVFVVDYGAPVNMFYVGCLAVTGDRASQHGSTPAPKEPTAH